MSKTNKNGTLVLSREDGERVNIEIPWSKLQWLVKAGKSARMSILAYRIKQKPGQPGVVSLGFEDEDFVFDIQRPERAKYAKS